jgi:hypothetical protein
MIDFFFDKLFRSRVCRGREAEVIPTNVPSSFPGQDQDNRSHEQERLMLADPAIMKFQFMKNAAIPTNRPRINAIPIKNSPTATSLATRHKPGHQHPCRKPRYQSNEISGGRFGMATTLRNLSASPVCTHAGFELVQSSFHHCAQPDANNQPDEQRGSLSSFWIAAVLRSRFFSTVAMIYFSCSDVCLT